MISLKEKMLGESIISSTGSGKEGLKMKIESWLKEHGITQYKMNDDLSLSVHSMFVLTEKIPDFVDIQYANRVCVKSEDALFNLPKHIHTLILEDMALDTFEAVDAMYDCAILAVSNCDIKSLRKIPSPDLKLIIGNNKQNFAKKDIKKAGVKLHPNNISNVGKLSYDYGSGIVVIGPNDQEYLNSELGKLSILYKQLLPEMKKFSYNCKAGNSRVYMNIDFLSKDEHPHHISSNSIYINFRYDTDGSVLELGNTGHLELTDADRAGKYKYYALKGVCDPYYDAGGKKFRAIRLDQFTAKNIFDKTKDWLRAVVDAALEDQGGQLKRK